MFTVSTFGVVKTGRLMCVAQYDGLSNTANHIVSSASVHPATSKFPGLVIMWVLAVGKGLHRGVVHRSYTHTHMGSAYGHSNPSLLIGVTTAIGVSMSHRQALEHGKIKSPSVGK